jgi:pimeloyl-ACP methyl ester carboxylesterase
VSQPSNGQSDMTAGQLEARHRSVEVPGGRIHLVEQGEGPLVLLVHGFPESWYSWRHQLPAIAGAGFRAVAVDVRGYGRSSKPSAVDGYRMLAHVADNVGVVHALGV